MIIPNRVSGVVKPEDAQEFRRNSDAFIAKLPVVDLDDKERASLIHLKAGNLDFVRSAVKLVETEPGFLPRNFDIVEFKKDAQLFDDLFSLKLYLASIHQRIEDTANVAGNEAYAAALVVYATAQTAGIGTEGIDPYLDEMARRFARKSKSKPEPQPAHSK